MAERPCVVLIPGLLCDAEIWAAHEAALKADYDVIALGFMRFATIEAMAEDVLRLAPARFSVAGHSMGGRVALEVVRREPGRVRGLCLFDTGFQPARPGEEVTRYALADLAEQTGMEALAQAWLPPMLSPRALADAALVHRLTEMVSRADTALFRLQINALLKRPNAKPLLAKIECPTSVLVGSEDTWSPVEQHRALAAQIPNATLEIIDGCGHMSLAEQPEVTTAALQRWMERQMAETADSKLSLQG